MRAPAVARVPDSRIVETTVLVTAAGAPGCPRLIRALREAGHAVVGSDANPRSAGSRLCDRFAVVPRGDDPGFIPAMRAAAAELGAHVVFPTSSAEILAWARARDGFGLPVLAGPAAGVEAASDKADTFRVAEAAGVPHPQTIEVADPDAFAAAVRELGYPGRRVVMKPTQAKGSRGMRILDRTADRRRWLLESRPGEAAPERLEDVLALLGDGPFPAYIVQEYLDGPEETVDAICLAGELLLPMTRTREALRAGLAMDFTLIDRPREEEYSARLAAELQMDYFLSVQFKGGKLMEINPRVSTIVYTPEINPPALAVGLALGTTDPGELRRLRPRVPIGRRAIRYFDQVEFD
jgi:glutathione synthase/RimK-type ligase-like ATP-grasp enzyme